MIKYAAVSEKGSRPNNQDALFGAVAGDIAIMAVADGMGGHSFGERASTAIIKGLDECWRYIADNIAALSGDEAFCMLKDTIRHVNKELYEEYAGKGIISGSTIVLLFIWRDEYMVMSVGDSHIYHLRDGKIKTMTVDDVWENKEEVLLTMSEQQRREDPRCGKLTAAIGPGPNIFIHEHRGMLEGQDRFLLCSDGIYRYCNEKDMERLMKNRWLSEKKIIDRLVKKVIKNNTKDNYSAIFCRCRATL